MDNFLKEVRQSLENGRFVKLSLGNYTGSEPDLKKILIRPVIIKKEEKLSFVLSYKTRDITKNFEIPKGVDEIAQFLKKFLAASLFTIDADIFYQNKAGKIIIRKAPASAKEISRFHDKQKNRMISAQGQSYLHDLGITDQSGQVYKNAQDKFRQINKYVEILNPLVAQLPDKILHVADMGSGKGYLTFALYDYIQQTGRRAVVTGIEFRKDMVDFCNKIAEKAQFDNLSFIEGTIENYQPEKLDILIALHACDTATDDALFKGIKAEADLIVVAPCCHKQIRREIEKSQSVNDLQFITRHGILLERQSEMATDALRALLLEYCGYTVKVFEFISSEHTAKNIMITAVKNRKSGNADILRQIKEAKDYFGIKEQKLDSLLNIQ